MATYTWPVGLPQSPQTNYSESSGLLILSTPMDMGVSKRRKRGKLPSSMNVIFMMTSSQINTLDTFINDTIKGTARFNFTHPRKGTNLEVRIVPSGEGNLYNASYISPELYSVSMNLEIMP